MIIVADSGSTKTDWRIFAGSERIEEVQTLGLNPHQTSESEFKEEIEASQVSSWAKREVAELYFYGSGVNTDEMQQELIRRFRLFFDTVRLNISSDLLGAARAVYGKKSGLIGILGTGSNSGWYNGKEITQNISPLGYILGDEGGGNALGKRLIASFLRDELPIDIREQFILYYPEYKSLIEKVYGESQKSRFLASFAPFVHKMREHPAITNLIRKEFDNYFNVIGKYDSIQEISLVGSIAYYFKDILTKVADARGIRIIEIMKSPIDRLTLYHKSAY